MLQGQLEVYTGRGSLSPLLRAGVRPGCPQHCCGPVILGADGGETHVRDTPRWFCAPHASSRADCSWNFCGDDAGGCALGAPPPALTVPSWSAQDTAQEAAVLVPEP